MTSVCKWKLQGRQNGGSWISEPISQANEVRLFGLSHHTWTSDCLGVATRPSARNGRLIAVASHMACEQDDSEARTRRGQSVPKSRIERHTSIIYFHGMGRPRRYEEVSRVLDSMDRYASSDAIGNVGMLRGQKVGLEPNRVMAAGDPVTFFKFARFIPRAGRTAQLVGVFRLYENFWSPAAAGGIAAFGVLFWLLRRTLHPFFVLTRPWRAHQRLKRTYLNRLFYDRGKRPVEIYRELGRAYREFEGMEARRQFPRGGFADFMQFLRARAGKDVALHSQLFAVASQWRDTLVRAQVGVILLALTAYAGLSGIAIWLLFVAASMLSWAGVSWSWVAGIAGAHPTLPYSVVIISGLGLVLLGFAIARFLEQYVSDVVFWTTTLEKDVRHQKRQEILRAAEDMVLHVLDDPQCERIVVLGHSLGTAIAHETLLRLGRRLKADYEARLDGPSRYEALRKISHIITYGSPIDRISYFFNLTYSRYHRFNRVADELMGQASDLPYKDKRQPIIQWVNIRDRADPIASRLFSPRGAIPNREEVQEVEVASSHFPNPGGAHTGYFESWLASKVVYDLAVLGRSALQLASDRPRWSVRVATVLRWTTWLSAAGFAWALGLGGFGFLAGWSGLVAVAQSVALLDALLLGLFWIVGKALDWVSPLTLRA